MFDILLSTVPKAVSNQLLAAGLLGKSNLAMSFINSINFIFIICNISISI